MNDTPLHSQHSQPARKVNSLLLIVAMISLVIGGAAGAIFGSLAGGTLHGTAQSVISESSSAKTQSVVEEESSTIAAVSKVSPSVVSVILTQDLSKLRQSNPFFNFYSPNSQQGTQEVGAGTGFIVSADGMILTNAHVVSNQNVDLTVVFTDGGEHAAKVLAIDTAYDLAIIKIEEKNLPIIKFGNSDSIKLGQTVIAIGNALGEFQNTVTKGVISGISRTVTAGDNSGSTEQIDHAIQTDAAINSGNSGGPLINLAGEVIGVNTAVSQQGQLIGFAIPSNTARQVVESVVKTGKIVRPYLGIRYVPIDASVKQQNNLSVDYGALIARGTVVGEVAVLPGSPADKAGIVENDIILEINGTKIMQDNGLATIIRGYNVGDTIHLKILHDGKEKTVDVTLEAYKESP